MGVEGPEEHLVDLAVAPPLRDGGVEPCREIQRHVRRVVPHMLEPRQLPEVRRLAAEVTFQGLGEGHEQFGDPRPGQDVGRQEGRELGGQIAGVVGQLAPQPAGRPPTVVGRTVAEAQQEA